MSIIFTNPIDDIAEAIANGALKEHDAITTRLMTWVADELDDRANDDKITMIADLAAWAMIMQHRATKIAVETHYIAELPQGKQPVVIGKYRFIPTEPSN